jgi:hypothetical protein
MAAPALLLLRGGSDGYELRSRYIGAPMDHSCAACADSQREPKWEWAGFLGYSEYRKVRAGFLGYSEYRKVRKNHQRIIGALLENTA